MYKVYCDNYLIYDDHLESLNIFNTKLSLELNAVCSFTFTIYPDHPYFEKLQKMKSIIKVYQESRLIFCGRILNDVNGFYNEKKVTCESDLSYLLDSIQRPYEFTGTPAELFTQFINSHNSQVGDNHKFIIGNITVTDTNNYIARSDSNYMNTWDSIKDKLIDKLGGYLWLRYGDNGTYIDYLSDLNFLSEQKIEFSKNLLTLKRTVKADDIFTVIIPIGASIEDSQGNIVGKLTIEEVNSGKDYLENAEAIANYGRITKMVEWSDVTVASNLKTKGQQMLDESVLLSNTIELTAADLPNIEAFHLGTKVKIESDPHGIDSQYLVKKLSIDILNPSKNKLQVGSSFFSMTENQNNEMKSVSSQVNSKVEGFRNDILAVTTKQIASSVQVGSSEILNTVSQTYYNKEEIPQIISSQTSQLSQDVDGWTQSFTTFKQIYDVDKQGTDQQFEEIQKYIRYIDGKIILGEVGNELELRIANDRMSFFQNNTEVAYLSNNKLFVTDGEYTNSLQLGKFAFLPRSNGNLSFKKVRD